MSECILTDYGETQIANALTTGSTINIFTVKIGSSNSFNLVPSLTTIPNIVDTITDNEVLSKVVLREDTMEFRVYLGTNFGTYDIGAISLWDNTDQMLIAGKVDNIIHKTATTADAYGNTVQFKLPINLSNISQLVTSIGTEFFVDGKTILLSSQNQLTSGVVPHHVFDIFQNASLETPPGALPMWTGELVYTEGSRDEFFAKAQAAANGGFIRTLTESAWQSEVASKGWTNAFVINANDKSIRLPKYKGILYMSDPSTSETNKVTGSASGTYGFITIPTYIQVDTAAVPATIAQCNAFTESLRNFANQFVTLGTKQSPSADKTWGGAQVFNNIVTTNNTLNAKGTNNLSGATKISGTLTSSGNGNFTGNTYNCNGTWTFNDIIQGTTYRALWGDLAEYYESDKRYPEGTLIKFGGIKEITIANVSVNGVISTEPGFILNAKKKLKKHDLPVAIAGRVPVRVLGRVRKFDNLTLSEIDGVAKVYNPDMDLGKPIIAKSLENKLENSESLVLCVTNFNLL